MRVLFGKAAAILLVAVAAIIGVAYYNLSEASSHSAVRSFSSPTVAPGGELQVTIQTTGLGPLGRVQETLPARFDYLGSDLPADRVRVNGQTVTFVLLGVDSFTYRVSAPTTPGDYIFNLCTVSDVIDGLSNFFQLCFPPDSDSEVTVTAPVPTPTATPTSTPTTVPTPDATPVATATTVPTPDATPVATPTATPTMVPTPDTTPTVTPTTVPTPDGTPVATPTTVPTPDATPVPTATAVPTATPTATHTPIPQPSSGVGITVSSGGAHYCALHSTTGSILCWGSNEQGQASPPRTGRYTTIVSGESHSCALRSDGAVVCWGTITVNP